MSIFRIVNPVKDDYRLAHLFSDRLLGAGVTGQGDLDQHKARLPARRGLLNEKMQAIRCDHDGLKMAEVSNGHLILRTKHHGETHVKVVALNDLKVGRRTTQDRPS